MTAGSRDPLTNSIEELSRKKRSLAAVVRDVGRLSVMDSVDLVLDICDELANAHANGIVHGDLGLHRVRTMWPRRSGASVDIFALDSDDTGAIDFRAVFQTPAQAPEQRAGKIGSQRSDIWAVGAILHALIGGGPPTKRPVREVLAGAPAALVTCVEQCLAENPADRPSTIDDVAGALASFASSPPERFQQLARRRLAALKAKHVNEKVSTLAKLDDAAVKRESADRIFAVSSLSGVMAMPIDPEVALPSVSMDAAVVVHIDERPTNVVHADERPTNYAPRETLPPIGPAPIVERTQPFVRAGMTTKPMLEPWLPPVEAPVRAASSFRAATAYSASSIPAAPVAPMYPGTVTVHAAQPAQRTPTPAPMPAYRPRQQSYHPPSLGPVVVSTANDSDGVSIPRSGRVPSFADLEQYREAKRASRRSATVAVIIAAAVLILGFGFGSRIIERDRAAMKAAETSAAAPPPAATPLPAAKNSPSDATPISALPIASTPVAAPAPTTPPKPAPTATPKRSHHAPVTRTQPTAPAEPSPIPTTSQDDRPEAAPTNALSDALGGKKQAAPANALEGAL